MSVKAQRVLYIVGGALLILFGVLWSIIGPTTKVTYRAVEGVSVFAALYVVAQAVERVTEWVVDLLSLLPESPEERKGDGLREIRAANSTLNGNPTLADFELRLTAAEGGGDQAMRSVVASTEAASAQKSEGEKKVTEARRDITFLAHGVSMTIAALGDNGLNYQLFTSIGVDGVNPRVDRLFTVLAVAGGTKALHELIGRFQKTKEAAEAAAKTS